MTADNHTAESASDRVHAAMCETHEGIALIESAVTVLAETHTAPTFRAVTSLDAALPKLKRALTLLDAGQAREGAAADAERFLQLIVCAGAHDRFRAMAIRKEQGLEAAIKFIGECTLTDEADVPADSELSRRVANLGMELWETPDGRQLVLDGTEAVFIHRHDNDDSLESWLAGNAADDAELAPEHRSGRGESYLTRDDHARLSGLVESLHDEIGGFRLEGVEYEDEPAKVEGSNDPSSRAARKPRLGQAGDAINEAQTLVQAIFVGMDDKAEITLAPEVRDLCNLVHGTLEQARKALHLDDAS